MQILRLLLPAPVLCLATAKNIILLENKELGKGCFKPSAHILQLIFFHNPAMVGDIIKHSLSKFLSWFLNKSGCNVCETIIFTGKNSAYRKLTMCALCRKSVRKEKKKCQKGNAFSSNLETHISKIVSLES